MNVSKPYPVWVWLNDALFILYWVGDPEGPTALTQLKTKQINHFDMKFKSKRKPVQTCWLNKNALNKKKKTVLYKWS